MSCDMGHHHLRWGQVTAIHSRQPLRFCIQPLAESTACGLPGLAHLRPDGRQSLA